MWPGRSRARPGSAGAPELPDRGRRPDPPEPLESFLRTLRLAFGAERAVVFRLDRERDRWRAARESPADGVRPLARRSIPTGGHPLTWCLREELVVQVETADLFGKSEGVGWTLAGAVPGRDRSLLVSFTGSPPVPARRTMRTALRHLEALLDLSPGGDSLAAAGGEPFDPTGGRA